MDNNDKIIRLAVVGVIGLVAGKKIVNGTWTVIGKTAIGINNLVEKRRFNKKIKKGLKDGSMVKVDGQ